MQQDKKRRNFIKTTFREFLYENKDNQEVLLTKLKGMKLLDENIVDVYIDDDRLTIILETGKSYGSDGWRVDLYVKDGNIYKTGGSNTKDRVLKIKKFITDNDIINYGIDHIVVSQWLD
jgi:hypothetical protein